MTTLHILSNPNTPAHINNRIDPFSIAVVKFINNMVNRGWNCIHYGIKGCEVNCKTEIVLHNLDTDQQKNVEFYNQNAGIAIGKNKQPGDLILCFYGWDNKVAAEMNPDCVIIEPSIGYTTNAIFAPYRVFVSYATMHMFYGERRMLMSPSWNDAVIPNAFTPSEFEFSANKKDYILYFGRIIDAKGVKLAIEATQQTGQNLYIAGPGTLADIGYTETPSHVTLLGLCNSDQRRILMRDARAIIGPTLYVEPFGNMIIEGYFSGTPAITTDWGGFTETVVNGVTGFRCREFKDFINALHNINTIDPHVCRQWAEKNYSEEIIHDKFDDYLRKIIANNFYRI